MRKNIKILSGDPHTLGIPSCSHLPSTGPSPCMHPTVRTSTLLALPHYAQAPRLLWVLENISAVLRAVKTPSPRGAPRALLKTFPCLLPPSRALPTNRLNEVRAEEGKLRDLNVPLGTLLRASPRAKALPCPPGVDQLHARHSGLSEAQAGKRGRVLGLRWVAQGGHPTGSPHSVCMLGGRGVFASTRALRASASSPTHAGRPPGGTCPASASAWGNARAPRSSSTNRGPAEGAPRTSPAPRWAPRRTSVALPSLAAPVPGSSALPAPDAASPAGRPHPVPPYLGRRARSRRAGGRAAAGRSGTRRRRARPASGPWRPGRGGAAAAGMPGTRAGSGLPAARPPARPGPGPWREWGRASDLTVPEMSRLKPKPFSNICSPSPNTPWYYAP